MATVNPSIIFEQQTLTQEQKDQVLSNIGAMKSFDGVPFTSSDRNKLDGIDSGAEVNTIETVKVNGSALNPDANRAVDIIVPEVDTTYNASSLNPQSGTAVAAAIAASGNVPTPSASDDGKVLKAYETDPTTHAMAYKWDVADSGIPSHTSGDDGKVLGVTNEGQTLAWVSQPTVNDSTVSVKIGSSAATAVGTMTTNQSAASDIVVPMASATESGGDWTYVDGAMAGTDKKKLNGISSGAEVNTIQSITVNGTAVTPDANRVVAISTPVTHVLGIYKQNDPPNDGYYLVDVADESSPVSYITYTQLSDWFDNGDTILLRDSDGFYCSLDYLESDQISFYGSKNGCYAFSDDDHDHVYSAADPFSYGGINGVSVDGIDLPLDAHGCVDIEMPTVDQTYDSASENAQSGVAVASAVSGVKAVPAVTSSDNGKVLMASYSNGAGTYSWDTCGNENVIESITVNNESTTISSKTVNIPAAVASVSGVGGSSGVLTPSDKEKLDGLVSNVKADWNAASGSAAEILNKPTIPTVDQAYDGSSTNAQSGVAVASAVSGVKAVPTVTSNDDGKVLKASYSGGVASYSWDTDGGGEANVINTVKVNGTALVPDANKAVDVSVPEVKLEGAASSLTPSSNVVTIPNAIATGETGASNGLMTADDKKTVSESVIYKANPTSGAEYLLAQRLYVVRSDQEIINIISGGGADGQGTILFRIG